MGVDLTSSELPTWAVSVCAISKDWESRLVAVSLYSEVSRLIYQDGLPFCMSQTMLRV